MSSDDVAIRVENLSKCYQIYDRPQDRLRQSIIPRLQRLVGGAPTQYFREFWALRDVSFDVKQGETVGIIGRNGSGKSTLLQMICGTLTPTSGTIQTNGRIAALLELGSGFNPEFTGRENVYLNAAVLGLSKEDIDARFADIAAFADIGEFIEQPVKTYSSGMFVRLAFAVIAHVDADILVIDEALAVGDAVFTQKCARFLRSFRERGTLLFVSHDTSFVINLCQSAIWLDRGSIRMRSVALDVANAYSEYTAQEIYGEAVKLSSLKGVSDEDNYVPSPEPGRECVDTKIELFDNIANSNGWQSGAAEIESVALTDRYGLPVKVFAGGEKVQLTIKARVHSGLSSPIIGFFVKDRLGQPLFGEHTYTYTQPPIITVGGDVLEARFLFTLPLLPNGDYSMTVSIADGNPHENVQHHWLHDAVLIRVSSPKLRYGLVGIPFESVVMQLDRP